MPKVLRILNRINVGGPVLNVAYLSKFLQPEFETRILVGNIEQGEGDGSYILDGLDLPFEKVPNMNRSLNPIRDFKALLYIIKAINEFQPDIVHTHAAKAGALGRFACLFTKKRPAVILHTYHGNVFDGYFSPLKTKIFLFIERSLAKISSGIVSISNLQKQELVHKYAIADENKINLIPLGFELDKFQQSVAEKRMKARNEFFVDDDTVLLVITGRLTEIKNHKLFLDIIANCKKLTSLKFKSLLVGNGELYDTLKSHAQVLGLRVVEEHTSKDGNYDVLFTSWRRDIDYINAGADIAVLTSTNEGTPVSIIEAMAAGKAVITTNVGGVQDFIQNEVNGIVSSSNLNEFSNKLVKLIADREFRRTLGDNAVSTAFKLFSYDRLLSDMRSCYSKLLK